MENIQLTDDLNTLAVIMIAHNLIEPLNSKAEQGVRVIFKVRKWRSRGRPVSHRHSGS